MLQSVWRVILLAACLSCAPLAVADNVVHYPRPESAPDERSRYTQRLLELVLERANPPYRLELNPLRMQQGRAIALLKSGEGIDVLSTMTSNEREQEMLPIRIPIDKGLIGWRLLLIKKDQVGKFGAVKTLNALKRLNAGQGNDWPDLRILRENGMSVYGTSNYASLFSMLESDRIDYFPRAISEIWAELELHQEQLTVEPTIVLHYPTAIYYFVRKDNTKLAEDIRTGLEAMIADGSFERLFQEYFGETIRRSRLKDRRVFELRNPLMPPQLPIERKSLWFHE
ncbi:MAG: substrate-binding periplasmic protein [Massilia sp.]